MATYHITHNHSAENCYGPPDEDIETVALWKQIGKNAEENNVDIKLFVLNPSEHIFFILLEAEDYLNVEKTIGQCKKTGKITVTPVVDVVHTPLNPFS